MPVHVQNPVLNNEVVVVWVNDLDDSQIRLLTCREGVRVFERDKLDERCAGARYCASIRQARAYWASEGVGDRHPVQLALRAARALGLLDGEQLVRFTHEPKDGYPLLREKEEGAR